MMRDEAQAQAVKLPYVLLWLALLALFAYLMPWVVNPGAGLSFGAYDLAEWASLHPEVRHGSPALLTTLLLRLPLLCLALMVGFAAPAPSLRSAGWWVGVLLLLFLVASALPPPNFFIEARTDPNYQQQFFLAFGALVGGALGLTGLLPTLRPYGVMLCAVLGTLAGLAGLLEAQHLMIGFSMPVAIGLGPAGWLLVMLAVLLLAGRSTQRVPTPR